MYGIMVVSEERRTGIPHSTYMWWVLSLQKLVSLCAQ